MADGKKIRTSTVILIITGVITAVICAVMNLYLIPLIETSADGMKCFDMSVFGYSYEEAKTFAGSLSSESLSVYLNRQLPLDFIYPLAYCIFFSLCILKMSKKKWLICLPVVLAAFDYTENICSIIMLKNADFSQGVAALARCATTAKTMLMYAVFIVIIVLFIIFAVNKKKANKTNNGEK
jgi:hypothetical protein